MVRHLAIGAREVSAYRFKPSSNPYAHSSRPEIAGSGLGPSGSLADLHRLKDYLSEFLKRELVQILRGLS